MQLRVTDEGVPNMQGNQRYLKNPDEMLSAFAELTMPKEKTPKINPIIFFFINSPRLLIIILKF